MIINLTLVIMGMATQALISAGGLYLGWELTIEYFMGVFLTDVSIIGLCIILRLAFAKQSVRTGG